MVVSRQMKEIKTKSDHTIFVYQNMSYYRILSSVKLHNIIRHHGILNYVISLCNIMPCHITYYHIIFYNIMTYYITEMESNESNIQYAHRIYPYRRVSSALVSLQQCQLWRSLPAVYCLYLQTRSQYWPLLSSFLGGQLLREKVDAS